MMSGGQGGQNDFHSARLSDWLESQRRFACQNPLQRAVLDGHTRLSREALEVGVGALVRRLQEAGLKPGDPVPVCIERSAFTIVAFLAVLRAGGTWLPIDPHYPAARIVTMLGSKPAVIIASLKTRETLPDVDCPIIYEEDCQTDKDSVIAADIQRFSDDLPAYIMFTSGTTGESRKVVVRRGAVASYVAALHQSLDFTEKDVYLHSASFSFSASIRQMIAPLGCGAAIVVAGEASRRDPFQLLDLIKNEGVTVWDTVPSLWATVEHVLARAGSRDSEVMLSPSVRLILLTGEALDWGLVAAWKRHIGKSIPIVNLYSQTEAAGTVSMFLIPDEATARTGAVPLGQALPDVSLRVLDKDQHQPGPGEVGEIYVAGKRLATGGGEEQKLATGDFARIDEDGMLVPVGRRDHRVKIRGFRVDLQEVESELMSDSMVSQAAVFVEASIRLVACVTPEAGADLSAEDIRKRLRQRLPDHAVPSKIIVIENMPLSDNGKVDREELERQCAQSADGPSQASEEADQTIRKIIAIWEKVLAYKDARGSDDFFVNGGDSLSAVTLFMDLEDHFGIRLPPSTLMTAATPESLATIIRDVPAANPVLPILALRAEGSLPPLFLVHAIWEHVPHFRELVKLLDPELPVYALEPIRNVEATARDLNVEQMVKQYAQQVRRAHPKGPYFLAGWSIGGSMAFGLAAELESVGDGPSELILIDPTSPGLRLEVRQQRAQKDAEKWAYLRKLGRRQMASFRLPPAEQWERFNWILQEAMRRLRERISRGSDYELSVRVRERVRVTFDQYQPPTYRGSAVLFRSNQVVFDSEMDLDLGWGAYVRGDLRIIRVPGDHVSMVIEPWNMKSLAEQISEIVNNATVSASSPGRQLTTDALELFLEETRKLSGKRYEERSPWINTVTSDSIRHFAYGICDDNPFWTDENYPRVSADDRLPAPPAFLVAARYPVLHGAALDLPLISLLRDIEYRWVTPVYAGDELQSTPEQGDVHDVVDSEGHRRIYVDGLVSYRNSEGHFVGSARSTVVRMLNQGGMQVDDWSIYRYTPEELDRIVSDIEAEIRTGARKFSEEEFKTGTRLPPIVRGPLTIGDMVCWHSAVGPSYRPGPLGYKDTLTAPQFRVYNPITGWPMKYMLHHEDVNLAHQRGMPAPFDNGIMRFGWVSPLVTNWMGDHGFLARLHVKINQPFLYGDTCWYSGEVTGRSREDDSWRVHISLHGSNQHGSIITTGSAEVLLPA